MCDKRPAQRAPECLFVPVTIISGRDLFQFAAGVIAKGVGQFHKSSTHGVHLSWRRVNLLLQPNSVSESIKTHPSGVNRQRKSHVLKSEDTVEMWRRKTSRATLNSRKQRHWACQRLLTHFDAKLRQQASAPIVGVQKPLSPATLFRRLLKCQCP